MYADRTARRRIDPASMAAAVGINGALIAALLVSSPGILEPFKPPIEGYNVPLPSPPPPPPEAEVRVKPSEKPIEATPVSRVDATDPIVDLPRPDDTLVGTTDSRPLGPPDDTPAAGGGGVTVDPPRPAPVLVDASPDPRAARDFQPPFPASEQRLGNDGTVVVRVLIGADGRIKQVQEVRASSEAFFDATRRQALSRWRFRPATRDGVPYESWRTMTVRFVLQD